ncbi:hypothetical protein ANN_26599 [Periplaneta americana]|uniref:Uncharacterized protein n=1 Tax=Periplaneta americana TaxID=6978 RepID=A0ABQ8RYU1_PERAM|nr:hypothetical protein ANN_26599 [Periplaneta americana]
METATERIPNLTGEQSDGITVFRIPPMTSLMLHRCRTGAISLQRWWQSPSAAISMKDDDGNWNYNITECEQQLFSQFPDYIITEYFSRNVINLIDKFRATECTERKKSVICPTKVTEDAVEDARERMQRGPNKSVKNRNGRHDTVSKTANAVEMYGSMQLNMLEELQPDRILLPISRAKYRQSWRNRELKTRKINIVAQQRSLRECQTQQNSGDYGGANYGLYNRGSQDKERLNLKHHKEQVVSLQEP